MRSQHFPSGTSRQPANSGLASTVCQHFLGAHLSIIRKCCPCPSQPPPAWQRAAILPHASTRSYSSPQLQQHSSQQHEVCSTPHTSSRTSGKAAKIIFRILPTQAGGGQASFATAPSSSGEAIELQHTGGSGGFGGNRGPGAWKGGDGSEGSFNPDSSGIFHIGSLQQALFGAAAVATAWSLSPGVAAAAGGRDGWVAAREQYPLER